MAAGSTDDAHLGLQSRIPALYAQTARCHRHITVFAEDDKGLRYSSRDQTCATRQKYAQLWEAAEGMTDVPVWTWDADGRYRFLEASDWMQSGHRFWLPHPSPDAEKLLLDDATIEWFLKGPRNFELALATGLLSQAAGITTLLPRLSDQPIVAWDLFTTRAATVQVRQLAIAATFGTHGQPRPLQEAVLVSWEEKSASADLWFFSACLLNAATVLISGNSHWQVALPLLARVPGGDPTSYGATELQRTDQIRLLKPDCRLQGLVTLAWCILEFLGQREPGAAPSASNPAAEQQEAREQESNWTTFPPPPPLCQLTRVHKANLVEDEVGDSGSILLWWGKACASDRPAECLMQQARAEGLWQSSLALAPVLRCTRPGDAP